MKSVRHINCCGQRGFLSERDAEKALGRARAKRARVRGAQIENRVYECEHGSWHLTSQSRREWDVAVAA